MFGFGFNIPACTGTWKDFLVYKEKYLTSKKAKRYLAKHPELAREFERLDKWATRCKANEDARNIEALKERAKITTEKQMIEGDTQ